jgi:hypothetical protein
LGGRTEPKNRVCAGCQRVYNTGSDRAHSCLCFGNQGYRTQLHTAIVQVVERSAKKMTPGWETEEGQHNIVEKEYDVGNVTTRIVSGEIVESRTVRVDVV